jgi:hypothetical protein
VIAGENFSLLFSSCTGSFTDGTHPHSTGSMKTARAAQLHAFCEEKGELQFRASVLQTLVWEFQFLTAGLRFFIEGLQSFDVLMQKNGRVACTFSGVARAFVVKTPE